MVNDGIVLIQHSVGNYTHGALNPASNAGGGQPPRRAGVVGYPKDMGGSWYLLSNGDKIQGQVKAKKAQSALSG